MHDNFAILHFVVALQSLVMFLFNALSLDFDSAMHCPPPADSGELVTYMDTDMDLTRLNHIMFLFRGCQDSAMVFTDGPHADGIGYELVIGGWENQGSLIRYVLYIEWI